MVRERVNPDEGGCCAVLIDAFSFSTTPGADRDPPNHVHVTCHSECPSVPHPAFIGSGLLLGMTTSS